MAAENAANANVEKMIENSQGLKYEMRDGLTSFFVLTSFLYITSALLHFQ